MSCFAKKHTGFYKVRAKRWNLCISESFAKGTPGLRADDSEIVDGMRGPFKPVQCSRFARVSEWTAGFGGTGHDLFIKEYLYRSAWDFIKHLLRPSRAMRAFKASIMLTENALLSPEVVAVGQLKYGPICLKNFIVTRKIKAANSLYDCLDENGHLSSPQALSEKRRFVRQLGTVIGRMHAANIVHGDLRPGNIFAAKNKNGWNFFLLDNERTGKVWKVPHHLRLKNLVQMNMLPQSMGSMTDRMRFYRAYLQQNPNLQTAYKVLAKQVAKRTQQRLNENEQRTTSSDRS